MKLTRWLVIGACGAVLSATLSQGVLRRVEGGAATPPATRALPPRPTGPSGPGVMVDAEGKRYETRPGAFAEREQGEAPLAGPAVAQLPSGPDRADRRRAVWLLGGAAVFALALVLVAAKRFKPRF